MSELTGATFKSLGLRDALVKVVAELGYEAPTPVQVKTIPLLLAGRDVIGQAQTGTGKTAAFALPILEKIDPSKRTTQALVLAPTRELAMQVAEAIHSYAKNISDISVLPVYGGAPMVTQLKRLERGAQIVVGTPGRLIDHLDRKSLRLDSVRLVVLDEADEMLKMGFIDEVERILGQVPAERQVALFSATMPAGVVRIAQRHLHDPVTIEIEHHSVAAPAIEQRFLNVSEGQKLEVLTQILELESSEAVLIFRRTKNGAAELAEKLEARGFAAQAMHGDMTQPLRESVIRRLRSGQVEIVVATDVAARGLDVEQIAHVINYDIPNDVEAYVHRIGRTGRAGRSGVATLFITPRERRMMREIERFTGTVIKPMKMPTRADVAARRIAIFKESLRKNVEQGDLDLYLELVEQLAVEGPFDIAEIAAAAARIASGSKALAPSEDEVSDERPPKFVREPRSHHVPPVRPMRRDVRPPAGEDRAAPASRESRPPSPQGSNVRKVRLSMALGKRDGIRPADVVGSIANEAGVPGREIGPIDIRDEITFVVLPLEYRDQVLAKLAHRRFRGKPVDIRVAGAEAGEAPARAGQSAVNVRRDDARGRPGGGKKESAPRYSGGRDEAKRESGARTPFYDRVRPGKKKGSDSPRSGPRKRKP